MVTAEEETLHQDLRTLYGEHHVWLQGWLRRRLGRDDRHDAPDLAQDTFLRLLVSGQTTGIREPRPFLATIASRLLANRHRHKRLEQAYLDALASLPDAVAPPPETRLIALELLQRVDRALEGLPLRARQAFLLTHLEGLSYREIAERLSVSTSSVKQYLMRANRLCLFGF